MLQKLIVLLLALFIAKYSSAQNATEILVNSAANVYLHNSSDTRIQIKDDDKTVNSTSSFLNNGVITINEKNNYDAHIYVPFSNLKTITNNGSAFVSADASVSSPSLNITQNGSGFIALNINSDKLHVLNNGSGEISLSGNAKTSVLNCNASGTIDAEKLSSEDILANIQGSGDIKINPTGTVRVNKNGSGDIVDKNAEGKGTYTEEEEERIVKNEDGSVDTIKLKIGKRNVIILDKDENDSANNSDNKSKEKKKKTKIDFGGLEIGLLSWRDNEFNELDSTFHKNKNVLKSNSVNINLFEKKLFGTEKAKVVSGLGFSFNYFRFADNWRPMEEKDEFSMQQIDTVTKTVKRKLVTSSLSVPLMLELSTAKSKKSLRLSAGVIGHYRFATALKEKISGDRSESKTTRDDFNLKNFRYDATVRIGMNNFYVFANYGLTSMFNDKEGSDVRPLTVGVSILGL